MIHSMRRACALFLVLTLLMTGTAAALFGKKPAEVPEEGAPIAKELELTTYREIPVQGQFQATDPEGEDLTYALAEEPGKGTVEISGADFTYIPAAGKTGTDRFTYTAADSAGHVSKAAVVTVTIRHTKSGVTYADTGDSAAAAAAQHLAETGVFTGAKIGGQYYFEPDRTVSRSEFVAMVLETAGADVEAVTLTGFCDDAAIPTWAKGYAAAGVSQGILRGRSQAEGVAFRGADPITFNEAASVLNRALTVSDVDLEAWYGDREAVPSWAAQAVGNLESVSVLAAGSFGSAGLGEAITRADAAKMLSAASTLLEGRETGVLSWFR